MRVKTIVTFITLGIIILILNGCPSPHGQAPYITSLSYDTVSNELYVLQGDNILVFNNANKANGHISPSRIIFSSTINSSTPYTAISNIWLDHASNQLFVVAPYLHCILVFTDATTANGNVTPARAISVTTELTPPVSLWLDSNTNQLYVLRSNDDDILVFTDATIANGNVPPARVISGIATELNYPTGLWLDSNSDQLYVGSYVAFSSSTISILVFTQASTVNGNVAPERSITSTTLFTTPIWLWLDSPYNELYVVSGYDSIKYGIFVFTDATTANGNISPAREITTKPPLGGPLLYDSVTDQLYVVSQDAKGSRSIFVFDNASTLNGNITPSRVIYP